MSTSLTRRNGFTSLDPWRLVNEIERQVWNDWDTPWSFAPLGVSGTESRAAVPADVYETGDNVLIAASIPMLDPSTINVQVHNRVVSISGEQRPIFQADGETPYTQHLAGIPRYGKFGFSFTLPCDVESEHAQASYQDGLLRIVLPKPASAKPVQVQVSVGEPARQVATNPSAQIESAPASEGSGGPARGRGK